jgi:hypothetical protein
MMNPEQAAWAQLRLAMDDHWVAQRHEDRFSVGIPDVSFVLPGGHSGWIELKAANLAGKVVIRQSQILWMHRRAKIGAACFIMIRGVPGWCSIDFGKVGAEAIMNIRTFNDAVRVGHLAESAVEAFNLAWHNRCKMKLITGDTVFTDTPHRVEMQS